MPIRLLREEAMAYGKEKRQHNTMRVHEVVYDYIVTEAKQSRRSPPEELALLVDIHKLVRRAFGTDDARFIEAEIRRLQTVDETPNDKRSASPSTAPTGTAGRKSPLKPATAGSATLKAE